MRNIFGWLGNREQYKALAEAQEHMDKVQEVVGTLEKAINAYAAGQPLMELYEQIENTEHDADIIRRNLLNRLSEGLFLPPDREDLVHLVERLDDIADYACAAGRLLILLPRDIPADLQQDLVDEAKLLVDAAGKLGEALRHLSQGNMQQALEHCTQVEVVEEDADRQKTKLFRQIFADIDLPARTLLLLHDLIEAMENTADRTEDSADQLRIIAVKYKNA